MKHISVYEMISLLERKNNYLTDFQKLNNEELERITNNNFNNLEAFYFDRELLLNAMSRIDKSLKDFDTEQISTVGETVKKKILELLAQKRRHINSIINQDMKIHEFLNLQSLSTDNKKEKIA